MTISEIGCEFEPGAERVRQLDRHLREELDSSLAYLATELSGHVSIDSEELARFRQRVTTERTDPLTYAIYWDFVRAIDADDLDDARLLLQQLVRQPVREAGLRVVDLGDTASDPVAERYARFVDSDPDLPLILRPPGSEASARTRALIHDALALIEKADPPLAAELGELVSEIILCVSGQAAVRPTFDGASASMLWGAILINAEGTRDELSMVQMLAHESAHNLLFGLSADEALLTNDPAERYRSPLRVDARPLEGIYHATFVSARMFRSMRELLRSEVLGPEKMPAAEAEAERNRRAFLDGAGTLDQHAELTSRGRDILEGARHYVIRS